LEHIVSILEATFSIQEKPFIPAVEEEEFSCDFFPGFPRIRERERYQADGIKVMINYLFYFQ